MIWIQHQRIKIEIKTTILIEINRLKLVEEAGANQPALSFDLGYD